ncbi:MAG: hypothetical protein EP349_00935 [Alphaproteobacteria bacterium]|nr:MAG: hypothetical protein EP349_00935 [Alphaproteobacteria bacterium]
MKKKLAIGIPSNRPFETCRESIESAVNFCRKSGYHLVVSDNSGDEVKAEKLREMMADDNMNYIETPPTDMMTNWSTAFDATAGYDYVLMMGDDDTIFGFGPSPSFDNIPADIVGIRPGVFGYADLKGIICVNTSQITSKNASERIAEHLTTSNGSNIGIFTFWRRDVFKSIMDLWLGPHPTRGTYCDWAVMNGFVSSGRVMSEPGSSYFYNLQNWAGGAKQIEEQVERAYTKTGLPKGSSAYSRIFNAVDSFIFVNRKDSPVSPQERFVTGAFCLDLYIKNYLNNLPRNTAHTNSAKIEKISQKLVGNDSIPSIFSVFAEILDAVKPGLAAKYKQFYKEAIGDEWGVFAPLQEAI